MNGDTLMISYLTFINLLAFLLMGLDKQKARQHKWRISERTLFLSAVLGGSPGSILGMQVFRHKTKHPSFVVGMPCILVLQILLVLFLFQKGILPR